MAARKYHPEDKKGNILMMSPVLVGVGAWIQFQSPRVSCVRSWMLSRTQKRDHGLLLYFQQFARQRTTSTHQVSPRLGFQKESAEWWPAATPA